MGGVSDSPRVIGSATESASAVREITSEVRAVVPGATTSLGVQTGTTCGRVGDEAQ